MNAALTRVEAEGLRRNFDPAYLNIDLSDKDPFTPVFYRQHSLSALFNFADVVQFSEIQDIRLKIKPC